MNLDSVRYRPLTPKMLATLKRCYERSKRSSHPNFSIEGRIIDLLRRNVIERVREGELIYHRITEKGLIILQNEKQTNEH